jgi:hypothetical protein
MLPALRSNPLRRIRVGGNGESKLENELWIACGLAENSERACRRMPVGNVPGSICIFLRCAMMFAFDNFEPDIHEAEFRSGDNVVLLKPKAFAVLQLLVENAHWMDK